jgi:UvrD-like helicase C-terminal domain
MSFCSRVLGFKGLERRAVVVCVNEDGSRPHARERFHVGMSRATDHVIVVADPDVIVRIGNTDLLDRLRNGSGAG